MTEEWPIAVPEAAAADRPVDRAPRRRGGRLATVVADFFLDPAQRLTEQERALMTTMLHGLLGSVADELSVRVPEASAEADPAELARDLSRAGLLQHEALLRLLLRRAQALAARQAAGGDGARPLLQQWTAHEDADVAASAMALLLARSRARDRHGRAMIDLADLPDREAGQLVNGVAAALARQCAPSAGPELVSAAGDLLTRAQQRDALEAHEARLIAALDGTERLSHDLLLTLASRGEASLLAEGLARGARIGSDDAWDLLTGGGESLALLLRLAGQSRETAAGIIAATEFSLGIADPGAVIDGFDRLDDAAVEAERRHLTASPAYRFAQAALERHG